MFTPMFSTNPLKTCTRGALALAAAAALCLPLAAGAQGAQGAQGDKQQAAKTPQQEKMTACNQEAGDKALKGDDRKKFMSQCLSNKPEAKVSQQDKMKNCNKEAKDKALKGNDRKKFMSDCLKGPAKS